MAFWSQAEFEPRRQHRFTLNFPLMTAGGGYQEYLAKSVSKPTATLSETPHKFMGNTYYYPGAVTWEAVTAQIVDSAGRLEGTPDGDSTFYQALLKSGYLLPAIGPDSITGAEPSMAQFPDNALNTSTPNKKAATDFALGGVKIKEWDGIGNLIGTWSLKNAFFTSINFGSLDYAGEELVTIDLSIRYDWADYKRSDAGA